MSDLVLLRHGQSAWNLSNLFTGWVDVPLTEQGVQEATDAGLLLKDFRFDVIYTSTQIRALQTALLAMLKNTSGKVPIVRPYPPATEEEKQHTEWYTIYGEAAKHNSIEVIRDWHLNERYYGELQGMNKKETADKYGEDQVHIWRRSYDVPPPNGEALKNTAERTIPFFKDTIVPLLHEGKNVFISAHGNSLRSIVMYLKDFSPEEILKYEIKTGQPLHFTYANGAFVHREM